MGVTYLIVYHELAVKHDIPLLSPEWCTKVKHAIEKKLTTSPEIFGIPLRNTLKGYRKLRVGDYRVIFRIESATIKIFVIGHRSHIYVLSNKRI